MPWGQKYPGKEGADRNQQSLESQRQTGHCCVTLTHPGDTALPPHQRHRTDPPGKPGTAPRGNGARGSQGDTGLGSWSPGDRSDRLDTELLRGHRWEPGSGHRWHSRTCSQDTPLGFKQLKTPWGPSLLPAGHGNGVVLPLTQGCTGPRVPSALSHCRNVPQDRAGTPARSSCPPGLTTCQEGTAVALGHLGRSVTAG